MRIHVIEDDKLFSKLIERILQFEKELEVVTFFNGSDFLERLTDNPDVVTLDLGLPDFEGAEIFRKIKQYDPNIEVVVISGQDDVRTAVQLLREGAYDYITKDESIRERLQHSVHNIINQKKLKRELSFLKNEVSLRYNYEQAIIGESSAIREVTGLVAKAVKIPNINVSIWGESGTGKELMAKIIHYNCERGDRPFVKVNLAAIPPEMLESELFGYEHGAFEGAYMMRLGKIEEANGGTLFIEEIQEMHQDVQLQLLRVLQEGEMTRIGGSLRISVNVRVISATCTDPSELVRSGKFREDLYFRLMGLPIHIPLLKDRQKDIVLLADYFLNQFNAQNGIPIQKISARARRKLLSYSFPGNVRELKAVIELAAVLSNNGKIDENDIVFNSANEMPDILSEELSLKEYNDMIIRFFMSKYNNVALVARKLEIGKSTIYNLLKSTESANCKKT